MVTVKLDSIEFRLKEYHDFSWLKKYGEAFWCVDETGSGCVCIGMENSAKQRKLSGRIKSRQCKQKRAL